MEGGMLLLISFKVVSTFSQACNVGAISAVYAETFNIHIQQKVLRSTFAPCFRPRQLLEPARRQKKRSGKVQIFAIFLTSKQNRLRRHPFEDDASFIKNTGVATAKLQRGELAAAAAPKIGEKS